MTAKPTPDALLGDHDQRTVLVADAGANAEASARAPFVYFDVATYVALQSDGIASITLEALRHMSDHQKGLAVKDYVVTANLKLGLNAVRSLRAALEKIEALAAPPKNTPAN